MIGDFNIVLYLLIYSSKLIENALGTLRLIVVANGKKGLGALLQFIIVALWLIVMGTVLIHISHDILTILFYALGSASGSYLGSYLEEKMALGSHLVISINNSESSEKIVNRARSLGYAVTTIDGEGTKEKRKILFIVSKRKNKMQLFNLIKRMDDTAMIMTEPVNNISGGKVRK